MTATILTHNGFITIQNPKTGGHATFRVNTGRKGKWEGTRFVGHLTGSDNENDYTSFGVVNPDGTIKVWRDFKGRNGDLSFHEKAALYLSNPTHYENKIGLTYQFAVRCRVCNRSLTTPQSIATGIGPTCAANMGVSQSDYITSNIHELAELTGIDTADASEVTQEHTELVRERFLDQAITKDNYINSEFIFKQSVSKLGSIMDTDRFFLLDKKVKESTWKTYRASLTLKEEDDYETFDDIVTVFEEWLKPFTLDKYSYLITENTASFWRGGVHIEIRIDKSNCQLLFGIEW